MRIEVYYVLFSLQSKVGLHKLVIKESYLTVFFRMSHAASSELHSFPSYRDGC